MLSVNWKLQECIGLFRLYFSPLVWSWNGLKNKHIFKSAWNENSPSLCHWSYCEQFIHACYISYISFDLVIFNQNVITLFFQWNDWILSGDACQTKSHSIFYNFFIINFIHIYFTVYKRRLGATSVSLCIFFCIYQQLVSRICQIISIRWWYRNWLDHAKTFSMNWAKTFPKQERHTRVTWGHQICVHTPHLAIPSQM